MTICLLLPSAHSTASALEFTPTSRPVDSLFGAYGTSLSFWLSQLPVLRLNLISRLQLQGLGNDCWLNFIVQGPPCYAQAPYKQHLPVLSEAFLLSWRTLWPLLTSHSSLLLRFGYHLLIALSGFGLFAALHVCEISPGTHTFFHPYTRHVYRKRFRAAIGFWLVWQSYPRLQPDIIPVRRARVLPLPSFRFRFTTDTLGFGCDLPAAGRSRDFHPLECALAGRTK